jgi:pyridoxal 5'-phosphate synthase pdxT subunit
VREQQATVGILALQGDVREHVRAVRERGLTAVLVRRPSDLDDVDGLILPGGESTAIMKLARMSGLVEPLRERIAAGLPAYGSCAGMILLADRVLDAGAQLPETIGGLDIVVRRNAFGRQVDWFETDLELDGVPGGPLRAVFIRAPWVEEVGPRARVIGRLEGGPASGRVVAVRQGDLLATSFHPELDGDGRVHDLFCYVVENRRATAPA